MSSTRQPKRSGLDSYQTPPRTIITLREFLLPYIKPTETMLEPCAGQGNIVAAFVDCFQKISSNDLAWTEDGKDYLSEPFPVHDWIISNPPFSLALECLQKSLIEAPNVAYLLRLNFLGSQKRRTFWQKHAPGTLLALSERPSFTGGGTDSTDYSWFIWSPRVPRGIYVR